MQRGYISYRFYHFLQITKIFPNSTQTLLARFDTYNAATLKFKKNVIHVTQFKWMLPINPSVWLLICSFFKQSALFCILNRRILMHTRENKWHAMCFYPCVRYQQSFTSRMRQGHILITSIKHTVMHFWQKNCFIAWSFEMRL